MRHTRENFVPGEDFVRRDVKGFTGSFGLTEQPHEPSGKVLMVGEHPKRGPISVYDHGLVGAHPAEHRIARPMWVEGQERAVVSVRRPHYRGGKTVVAPGGKQAFFARDFIS